MPCLIMTGVPEDNWRQAWRASCDARNRGWGYYRRMCKSGRHDLTGSTDPRNRCPQCQAEREATQSAVCSYCGAEHRTRNRDLCSSCQNRRRRYGDPASRQKQGESGYLGVYFAHQRSEGCLRNWYARIYTGGTRIYLGMFLTAEEAARARDEKIIELGLHLRECRPAKLNFPEMVYAQR